MSDHIVVLTTTNSLDLANTIAGELVKATLAACVNIIPNISSVYKWKGDVCSDTEFLLIIKAKAEHFARIGERIKSLHTYELPEVIALPIVAGDSAYLKWISEVSSGGSIQH